MTLKLDMPTLRRLVERTEDVPLLNHSNPFYFHMGSNDEYLYAKEPFAWVRDLLGHINNLAKQAFATRHLPNVLRP